MTNILVTVSGGLVRSVYSDDPDVSVQVIDWDAWDDDADGEADIPKKEYEHKEDEFDDSFVQNYGWLVDDGDLIRDEDRETVQVNMKRYPNVVW